MNEIWVCFVSAFQKNHQILADRIWLETTACLQVFQHLDDAEENLSDFPQDAIHGVQRDVPDVHVYYQWLLHPQSGVRYSHYDLLVPADMWTSNYTMQLPSTVQFAKKKMTMTQFFDPATFAGRTYQFPKLEGKLVRSVDPKSSWAPADARDVKTFFDVRTYQGRTDCRFEPLTGRLKGISECTRDRFEALFKISSHKPSQHEVLDPVAAAENVQAELESKPQSPEGTSELDAVNQDCEKIKSDDGEKQVSPVQPAAESQLAHTKFAEPDEACQAADPICDDNAIDRVPESAISTGDLAPHHLMENSEHVGSTDTTQLVVYDKLGNHAAASEILQLESEKHDQAADVSSVTVEPCIPTIEPVHGETIENTATENGNVDCGRSDNVSSPHAAAAEPLSSPTDSAEERLFKIFQPILHGEIAPVEDLSDSSDAENEQVLHAEETSAACEEPQGAVEPTQSVTDGTEPRPETQVMVALVEEQTQEKSFAMRLPKDMIQTMLQSPTATCVLKWKHNLQANTQICLVDGDQVGKMVATSKLGSIDVLGCLADLRVHPVFCSASALQKESWRSHVVTDKKKLYVWNLVDMKELDTPLELPPFRGRSIWIRLAELKPYVTREVPAMDLCETCEFFVKRLPEPEFQQLEKRIRALDGKTISIGSTCSGTDICVSMMKATMAKLSEMFGVSGLIYKLNYVNMLVI